MSALSELQQRFAATMLDDEASTLALKEHLAGEGHRRSAGLTAYRRSVQAILAGAVQATYPIIESIVGSAFLAEAARRYALAVPSRSGDLNDYGDGFNQFLSAYPAAEKLPYLPDVAAMEWAVHTVFGAANGPTQDLTLMANTPPEHWEALHFQIDPACTSLSSRWPLVRIWQVNQSGYSGDFSVDFSLAQSVLIHRREGNVQVDEITPAEMTLLAKLANHASLAEAVDAAEAVSADIDLAESLSTFIRLGVIRAASNGKIVNASTP